MPSCTNRASLFILCILFSLISAIPPIDSIRFTRVSYSRKGLPVRVILIAEYMRRVGGSDKDFVTQYRTAMAKGGIRLKQVDQKVIGLAVRMDEQIQNSGTYYKHKDILSALSSNSFQSDTDPNVILVPRKKEVTWQEVHQPTVQAPQHKVNFWSNFDGENLSGISFTISFCVLCALLLIYTLYYNRELSTIRALISIELIMLLVAVLFPLQIGYYTLLRITVSGVSAYTFISRVARDNNAVRWVSAIVFVLFNPFIPIHFDRETWIVLDLVVWVPIFWVLQQIIRLEKAQRSTHNSAEEPTI